MSISYRDHIGLQNSPPGVMTRQAYRVWEKIKKKGGRWQDIRARSHANCIRSGPAIIESTATHGTQRTRASNFSLGSFRVLQLCATRYRYMDTGRTIYLCVVVSGPPLIFWFKMIKNEVEYKLDRPGWDKFDIWMVYHVLEYGGSHKKPRQIKINEEPSHKLRGYADNTKRWPVQKNNYVLGF